MKRVLAALVGLAGVKHTAAVNGCCRANKCFKAIVDPSVNGVQDCSRLLVSTVTPAAVTVSNTLTVVPTEYTTVIDIQLKTATETTTAWTETLLYTISTTVTAATQTNVVTETQTVVASTQTVWQTVTVKPAGALDARDTATNPEPTYPPYASECQSWEKYVAACACVGIVPTTVTAATPTETVVIEQTSTHVNSVFTTVTNTVTQVVSVTATISVTEVNTIRVTATEAITKTQVAPITVTVSATVSQTLPPSCRIPTSVEFRARASQTDEPKNLVMLANPFNGASGEIVWDQPPSNLPQDVQNRGIWKLDNDGYLYLSRQIKNARGELMPGLYAYVGTGSEPYSGITLAAKDFIDTLIQEGGNFGYVRGCVKSGTGELNLNSGDKTKILFCGLPGTGVFLEKSNSNELEIQGGCTVLHPVVETL
ncbi:hypothetical protein VTI74DRAFT_8063 [Chaetomium olivicolor]